MLSLHNHSWRHRRAAQAAVVAALALALTTGCTQSPPQQEQRLDKAAGVAKFEITCTKDTWAQTRDSGRYGNGNMFGDVKPVKLGGEQGRRGLIKVTLTGPQLVDYLRMLDYDGHGGAEAKEDNAPVARRMYNAIAPVVDRIEPGRAPTEIPRAVVDDAAIAAGSTPAPTVKS